ncbi:STAS domain-containing protein [Streptomyces sp. NPDC020817]|uniref:STAS domain-containing protein n=1 Tax=Streptomyces sp. NPDC020817 TaxID=3365095 RepID=UPI0037AEBC85
MITIVDLGWLDFCDASGPSALVAGQHRARRHAGEPPLACPQGPVKRLLEVTAVWLELHTRNACDAAVFYGEVVIVPDAAPWDEGKPQVTVSAPDGGRFTLDEPAAPAAQAGGTARFRWRGSGTWKVTKPVHGGEPL